MRDLGPRWTEGRCDKCKLHFFLHPTVPCFPGQRVPYDPRPELDAEDLELIG